MDGSYGKLAFVATQSDVLQPSEIRRSLGLAKNATISGASHAEAALWLMSDAAECATARNTFTSERVQADFIAGLEEMAQDAGEQVRYHLLIKVLSRC